MRKTTKMAVVLAAMSVMVLGAATMVSADGKQGWVKEGSDWYYYNNDKAVTNGWALSGDSWYFLDDEGKMATEAFIDNEVPEVVDTDEVADADYNDYYYVNADGVMVTGWAKIKTDSSGKGPTAKDSTDWFYFGTSGLMYADTWVLSGSDWYYVDVNGKMVENYLLEDWNDKDYYLGDNGVMVTGWYRASEDDEDSTDNKLPNIVEKDWIYANASGELQKSGWKKVDSKWYYFGNVTAGVAVAGGHVDGSKVGSDYIMQDKVFIELENAKKDGTEIFYLTSSGAMETGLFKLTEDRVSSYYYAKDTGVLQHGVVSVGSRYYLFDDADYTRTDEVGNDDLDYVFVLKAGGYEYNEVNGVAVDSDSDVRTEINKDDTPAGKVYKIGTSSVWEKK